MTATLKSFKLLLAIVGAGMLTFAASAQNFITNGLPAPVAIGAVGNISLNGYGIATDSYNSHDTNFSTGGQYDPAKASTNGNVASMQGMVSLGNRTVIGNLYLGSSATFGGYGIVNGFIYYNYNFQLPDVALPPGASSWPAAATTSISTTNSKGKVSTIVTYDFKTNGNYIVNQDIPIVVESSVIVNLNITSTTFSAPA